MTYDVRYSDNQKNSMTVPDTMNYESKEIVKNS